MIFDIKWITDIVKRYEYGRIENTSEIFWYDEYAYSALAQFPKSEKFALVVDIKRCMDLILERIIEGNKKYYKKTTLQELDVEINKSKHMWDCPTY